MTTFPFHKKYIEILISSKHKPSIEPGRKLRFRPTLKVTDLEQFRLNFY